MADFAPFRGYRYKLAHPEQLADLAAPPYDMLDEEMIEALHEKNPHNFVRIIQNRTRESDRSNRDRHKRAAGLLHTWIEQGHLVQDPRPCMYVYRQTFEATVGAEAATYARTAVIGSLKLVDFDEGVVQPHEYTLPGPKVDRYELLAETNCNTGLIFGIAADEGALHRTVAGALPPQAAGVFHDDNGVRHELFVIDEPATLQTLSATLADRSILIADGHHRYETGLKYSRDTGRQEHGRIMMAVVSMGDPGLVIRPFHRLVKRNDRTTALHSAESLGRFFELQDAGEPSPETVRAFLRSEIDVEMLFLDGSAKRMYGLTTAAAGRDYLRDRAAGMSDRWNDLSVSKINRLCVQGIMGYDPSQVDFHDIMDFVNDAGDAYRRVMESETYAGVFFIRPIDIETVKRIVSNGERMPQKSTNFYPKVYSGLVLHRLGSA